MLRGIGVRVRVLLSRLGCSISCLTLLTPSSLLLFVLDQSSEQGQEQQIRQRRAFTRELEAMTRLRSPHTVHVYGAVTSRNDRRILVMELMSDGDFARS